MEGISELYEDYRSEIYQTDGYLPTPDRLDESVQSELSHRVQLLRHEDSYSVYKIDGCVQAKVPSDLFRQSMVDLWTARQSSHRTNAWGSVVVTVAGIGGTVFVNPLIAIIAGLSGICAVWHFHKANKASTQIDGWGASPSVAIAKRRKEAYEKGFQFVYRNDLKIQGVSNYAILLPFEVQHLFDKYFDHRCKELHMQTCNTNSQKKVWLDRFRVDNPISDGMLRYAHGTVPGEYASLSRNFEHVASLLKNVESEFSEMRIQRKQEAATQISLIESQRILALTIPDAALQAKLREAREVRDNKLRPKEEGSSVHAVLEEYESSVSGYRAIHALAILPINLYFDGKIKEANEALQASLNAIKKSEASAFSPYYEYGKEIVTAALNANNRNFVYMQPSFTPTQNFHIPSIPKIEINFKYEAPPGLNPDFLRAMQERPEPSAPAA